MITKFFRFYYNLIDEVAWGLMACVLVLIIASCLKVS
jgi:hypothetical protein